MIRATTLHAAALAAIHADAFPPGEAWDEAAMADILAMPGAFGFLDGRGGLILSRVVAGEAEILTLAVIQTGRRAGLGRALLDRVMKEVGSVPIFLEVSAGNHPAQCLYFSAGFEECGRRRDYYGIGMDALVLRCAQPGPNRD